MNNHHLNKIPKTISPPTPPMQKQTTIASAVLTHESATIILTYLRTMHIDLSLTLEFLRRFKNAGWPLPAHPTPNESEPSQIEQDVAVARQIALTATLRRLVNLPIYPSSTTTTTTTPTPVTNTLWTELASLFTEAEGISNWFHQNHGVSVAGGTREEEMRELKAVWDWDIGFFEPVIVELAGVLDKALKDATCWKYVEDPPLPMQRQERLEVPEKRQKQMALGKEKPLPALPDESMHTRPASSSSSSSSSSSFSTQNKIQIQTQSRQTTKKKLTTNPIEKVSCTTTLRPMLKSLLTGRAQSRIRQAAAAVEVDSHALSKNVVEKTKHDKPSRTDSAVHLDAKIDRRGQRDGGSARGGGVDQEVRVGCLARGEKGVYQEVRFGVGLLHKKEWDRVGSVGMDGGQREGYGMQSRPETPVEMEGYHGRSFRARLEREERVERAEEEEDIWVGVAEGHG